MPQSHVRTFRRWDSRQHILLHAGLPGADGCCRDGDDGDEDDDDDDNDDSGQHILLHACLPLADDRLEHDDPHYNPVFIFTICI